MRKLALSLYFALVAAPALALPGYTLTIVDNAQGNRVTGLNDSGIGVGFTTWEAIRFSRDGVAAVPFPGAVWNSEAFAINNAGTIVGAVVERRGESSRAFVIQDGVYRDLGGLKGSYSTAWGVNNAGTVLVNYDTISRSAGSYIWNANSGLVDLGALSTNGGMFANAINDRGQVVGTARGVDDDLHAFIWENGKMVDLTQLVIYGEFGFSVSGISEQGDVFGTANQRFTSHAWVIRDGSSDYYPDLTRITFIDSAGRIYGIDQQQQAVIVDGATTIRVSDLIEGAPDWILGMDAVNDNGDILTYACYDGNCNYTALLTPVPEPATYAMLLLGGFALYCRQRRRRG
ncbi:HAF repeat-containing PEP-CTERM protein [Pseudoduganella umbonata]|uniref:PEP-CTERM sorting domain-containing protein n=1 Tax=Pseudoduganella umbonata TaxID=864828 RepID=A0A4P8HKR3_9BURK|nr:HAF repeat-containing PEP-CTERM protein [Pseudoduganella umbonata]MBB3221052.1 putative HAF family extracellular repeat protein [Pseudoduganella umbonata]QCP10253.1 PEP-CTERM sorting domain-containing protein [Pseudoduganella umbonata]